jgi:hypothetical protein
MRWEVRYRVEASGLVGETRKPTVAITNNRVPVGTSKEIGIEKGPLCEIEQVHVWRRIKPQSKCLVRIPTGLSVDHFYGQGRTATCEKTRFKFEQRVVTN